MPTCHLCMLMYPPNAGKKLLGGRPKKATTWAPSGMARSWQLWKVINKSHPAPKLLGASGC